MSLFYLNHAWSTPVKTIEAKLLLTLFASMVDERGRCAPTGKTIRDLTGLTRDETNEAIMVLKEQGFIRQNECGYMLFPEGRAI